MSATTLNSYLTFRLGEEIFAAGVDRVLEILEIPGVTKIPCSPVFMRGAINLRGAVIPVIDLRIKFGLPETADTINSCIIVMHVSIEGTTITVGAVVDAVLEVQEIDDTKVQEAPSLGAKYKTEFIKGMLESDAYFIMLLDADKVFSLEEASVLQDIIGNSDPASEEPAAGRKEKQK